MTERELKTIFSAKKQKEGFEQVTFPAFLVWHQQSNYDEGCYYCGLTNEESLFLYNLRPHATRNGKRCKRLEIDRKDPVQLYNNLPNLVWCCYWCNNAKSNFFSEDEFKPVAKEMVKELRKIIHKNSLP